MRNKASKTVIENRENTEFTRLSVGARIQKASASFTILTGAG